MDLDGFSQTSLIALACHNFAKYFEIPEEGVTVHMVAESNAGLLAWGQCQLSTWESFASSTICKAKRAYEVYHGLDLGAATVAGLVSSSAGIIGWAICDLSSFTPAQQVLEETEFSDASMDLDGFSQTSLISSACHNFAKYFEIPEESVTAHMVAQSNAGLCGWSDCEISTCQSSPESSICKAKSAFDFYYYLAPGSTSVSDLVLSSAGIMGWANCASSGIACAQVQPPALMPMQNALQSARPHNPCQTCTYQQLRGRRRHRAHDESCSKRRRM